jgi:hypothetical protein
MGLLYQAKHNNFRTNSKIDIDFITDSLDVDERSRYESDEGDDLIVLKTPVENAGISDSEAMIITIPIGIIRTEEHIITVSAYKNEVVDYFSLTPPKGFDPADVEAFILHFFRKKCGGISKLLESKSIIERYFVRKVALLTLQKTKT